MKKTLIAASIAALAAGSANAAVTLHESETGSFATYGKIQLQLNNKDGVNQIQDNGSRFGFSGESVINENLKAFANTEFRFNAGYQNNADMDVRYSYAGVEGGFGKVTAGNFDSVYYTTVAAGHDIMEQDGYRTFDNKGEGFSLAYETVDMGGLKVLVGLRHFSEGTGAYPSDNVAPGNGDEAWNIQLGATYALNDALSLGFAFDQNNEDTSLGGADPIIGAGVNYAADAIGAGAVLELNGDLMYVHLTGSYTYGAGDVYGLISFGDDSNETGLDLAVGANYNLGENFYVYGEFAQGNDKYSAIGDVSSVTVGASYGW